MHTIELTTEELRLLYWEVADRNFGDLSENDLIPVLLKKLEDELEEAGL